MTATTLQVLLLIIIFALYTLALFYLRRRLLSAVQFAFWALLALFLPILGPFIVFAAQPGQRRQHPLINPVRHRRKVE